MKVKRSRGILLTLQGWQKLQAIINELEKKDNLGPKFIINEFSKRTGLHARTVTKVLHREEGIDRPTIECLFRAFNLELEKEDFTKSNLSVTPEKELVSKAPTVWQEMPDVPVFYGRADELTSLEQYLTGDRCRLVALLGMGGVGKTSLSVKLAERIQHEFDYFIWYSLRNAPPLKEFLRPILQFLSNQQQAEMDPPQDSNQGIYRLIHFFSEHRCLLILDNAEAILRSGDQAGNYREGYEKYGELFRQVGEQRHQSCILLTSREKPKEIGLLEGSSLPVRSFQLSGLREAEGQEIFNLQKDFTATEQEWNALIKHYAGNPLALRIVAAAIQELFDGSISKFLEYFKEESLLFDDIKDLLDCQFNRLSNLEKEIMYWLTIEREPVSLQQLKDNILSPGAQRKLPEGLRSLRQRSLIEMSSGNFTQQPVIMEYMTDRIVENFCEEILGSKIGLLMKYSLIKANAKDYVRESQIRFILEPITERMGTIFSAEEDTKKKIIQLLLKLKRAFPPVPGYGAGNILNLLCKLKIDLTGYDFSNLTVWQAYLRDVNLHHVNFAHSDLEKSVFTESFGNVLSISFSPDGKLLAIGDTNGEIRLWQVKNAKQILSLKRHESWVWSVSFSPDGQTLSSSSQDCTVKLWDLRTGQCLKTLQVGDHIIRSVSFSPDGQTLASGHGDATVRLWDILTGACLKTLQGHDRGVWSVGFSPDGQMLASGSDDRTVKLWHVPTGDCLKTLSSHTSWVWSVSFSPDGQTLASGSDDRTVKLWDVSTGACLKTLSGHRSWVWSVSFSSDGQTLASGSDDRTVKLWDVCSGECLETLQGHEHGVRSVGFSPSAQILASSSDDQTVRLWNAHTGRCLKTLQGHTGWIWSVRFSPDGQRLASSNHDHVVRVYDVRTGRCLHEMNGHTSCVRSISFSPDGQTLASSSDDRTVKLWDVHTGLCVRTLSSGDRRALSVNFSPVTHSERGASPEGTGHILACGNDDRTITLWNAQTGQCLKILSGHTRWVWSIRFSPDGQTLASGSLDYTVRLWDVRTGQCLKVLTGHSGWVSSVSFSPDGQTLASSSDDLTTRLWKVGDGTCLKILKGHHKGVWSNSFSPDGHMLATSSEDKTIKVWDIDTALCTKTLQGHSNGVWTVDFRPIGGASPQEIAHILASGSQDETIQLWDVETGENLKTLKAESPYEGMNIEGIRGLSNAQKTSLKALGAQECSEHAFAVKELEIPWSYSV
jgi:WD40 repeat protein